MRDGGCGRGKGGAGGGKRETRRSGKSFFFFFFLVPLLPGSEACQSAAFAESQLMSDERRRDG